MLGPLYRTLDRIRRRRYPENHGRIGEDLAHRYLQARGLTNWKMEPKVWAFLGDGESDEPESLGAITLAARENLDNIIWVVNCNLQRLDGPVRGNGKIIQECCFDYQGANVFKHDPDERP